MATQKEELVFVPVTEKSFTRGDEFICPISKWRVGTKVPLNVYDGDRPVCQCHTEEDAANIVAAMNYYTLVKEKEK